MKKFLTILLLLLTVSAFSQSVTEVIYPRYIQGVGSGNFADDKRVPYVCRMTVSGLTPNATYRYFNRFVASPAITGDPAVDNGQGNIIIPSTTGSFTRITGPNLGSTINSGAFTTDAGGTYTGWFISEPRESQAVFLPGNQIYWRIMLNDGAGGTQVAHRLTAINTVTVLKWEFWDPYLAPPFPPAGFDAAAIENAGGAAFIPKNLVFLYDNTGGTGRPISGSYIEDDGLLNDMNFNSYADFYETDVDAQGGKWGTIIPASLPNGIRNIRQFSLSTGNPVSQCTDADGDWDGTNTVDPVGFGYFVPLIIDCTPAPLVCNISLSTSVTNTTSCSGANNGAINLTVTGATAPVTYSWSNGATTEDVSGLAAGTYTVVVVDANGCNDTTTAVVSQPSLSVTGTASSILCFGQTNGSIDITVAGTPPFTYLWSNGATTEDLSGLAAGVYSVTVTDAGGCTGTASFTITQPTQLVASALAPPIPNCGVSTTVTISASGGTAPYSGTGTFTRTPGTYTFTVTDANGCTASTSVTITAAPCVTVTEVFYPRYVQGVGSGVSSQDRKVPYATRMTLGGLTPGATYRFFSRFVSDPNDATNGTGNFIIANQAGNFTRVASASLTTVGGYGEFTANGSGSYTGWFIIEPTSDPLYQPGTQLYFRIILNDGAGGGSVVTRASATNFVTVMHFGTTATDAGGNVNGSFLWGAPNPAFVAKNFVMLFDNEAGTGRPLTGTFIEADGTANTIANGYLPAYQTNVNELANRWGTIIPNNLASGVNNISQYALSDGSFVNRCISPNGQYSGIVIGGANNGTVVTTNTANANWGQTATATSLTPRNINCSPTGACNITLSTVVTNATCFATSTGAINLTVNGATAPITYSWSNGATTEDLVGIPAGTYTVTVTDAATCTATTTVTVTQPAELVAAESHTAILCFGGSSTVTISATGGTAPYTGTGTFTQSAGTQDYTVTDANGCTDVVSVTITQPTELVAASSAPPITTVGGTTTVTVSATGGTAPYTGTGTFVRGAGTYTFIVTDANGCTDETTITLTEPGCNITLSTVVTNVSCFGGENGAVNLTVSGANGAVTYSWSNGSTTEDISGLTAGTYTVTVTDAANCTATATVTITQPSELVAAESHTAILCFGGSSTVTISATGGTAPYTGTGTFTQSAGTQTYTVTDANGCTDVVSVTITQPAELVAAESHTAILCFGGSSTVTISATGGTAPYTGTGTFIQSAGTQTYTVTDANGCTDVVSVTVTQPSELVAAESHTAILCFGGSSTVTISAAGGTAPYTGTGTFTQSAGTQTYTVTDANGCTDVVSVTITQPAELVAAESHTAILCFGGSSTVTISATGGTDPYTGTGTFTQSAGTQTYTVTDANGCTDVISVTITQPSELVATSSAPPITTVGGTTTVTVSATGGTAPYTGTGTFVRGAGTYTFIVTDANGCTDETTITLTEPGCSITLSTVVTNVSCFGGENGAINLTVSDANGAVTYSWSNGSTTEDISGLTAGTYTVTVTDASNCTATATVTVTQPAAALVASSTAGTIECAGGTTTVTVTATGGTPPYSGTGTFTIPAGPYSFTVTDANGCTSVTSGTVTVTPDNTNPTITAPASLSVNTNDGCTATGINLGTPVTADNCSVASVTNNAPASFPLGTTTVTWTVTDGSGNTATATQTVTVTDNVNPVIFFQGTSLLPGVTGPTSSQSPYLLPTTPGGKFTSLISVNDLASGYRMVGLADGLGAFDNNNGTFTILMNHEVPNTLGITRAHGNRGAFVSKWIVNKSTLTVQSGSDLMQRVYLWNAATNSFGLATPAMSRFCSADLPGVSAFYNHSTGLGTLERIFMNGEESGVEGRGFGHIATGPATGDSYELPWLGKFAWENSVASPFAQNKTIVVGLDDGQNGQVYVYIGTKTNSGTDVDKAGLNNGKLFGVKVTGLVDEVSASFPAANTAFTMFDLGFVQNTTGAVLDATSEANQVTSFLRPEDGAWDPSNPNDFYFVTTNAFNSPTRLWRLRFADIANPELGGTITAVLDGTEGTQMLDNIGIDKTGHILLQEDVGNNNHNGKTWQYTIATDALTLVSKHDPARFGDLVGAVVTPPTAPFNRDEESSGVIDVSEILGPGMFIVTDQAHYAPATNTAEVVEGGQLLVYFNPASISAAPLAAAPDTVRAFVGAGCTATVDLGTPATADNCLIASVTNNAPATFPVGTTSVIWTVTDGSGNTATATQIVVVSDTTDPAITAPADITTGANNAGCTAATGINLGTPVTADNCSVATVTNDAPASFPVGATTVTWTVTDGSGNTATATQTVTVTTVVASSSVGSPILCNGGTTTVTVTAIGGTAPYTGTGTFTVGAGPYSFTVTDANGCTSVTSGTISQPALLEASSTAPPITTVGGTTTVTVSATGGTPPYTGTGTFVRGAGTYTFTVTDANGCTATTTITLSDPGCNITLTTAVTHVSCFGGENGAIDLTVNGASGAVTYSWSNGATTEDISGLMAGTYTVTVTDTSNCTATATVTITEPASALTATALGTGLSCAGTTNNGSVNLTVSGGTPPYTYLWSNGATTEDLVNLAPGTYSVTVTDANGCTATASATVAARFTASSTSVNNPCEYLTGTVTVTATGGVPPYTGTGVFTNVPFGNYSFTVTDATGCSRTVTGRIAGPLVASSLPGTIPCDSTTTTVTVTASGGVGPYSGLGTFTVGAGPYSFTVTDANGCTAVTSGTIADPACYTVTPVYYPLYVQGVGSGSPSDDRKVPYAARMTVGGLTANTTYRYYSRFTDNPADVNSNGVGTYILVDAGTGTFTRVTSASLSVAGRYSELTTDATGSYTGWFVVEPGSDPAFQPGTQLYWRILLNNGAGGGSVVTRITASEPVTVLGFGSTTGQGTGLRSTASTSLTAKNFIMLYDNMGGTGRPVSGTFIESDGTVNNVAAGYAPFYANNVDGVDKAWGSIIPNNLSSGINNITQYALTDGSFISKCTSATGEYGGTATANASGGLTALVISTCNDATVCDITLTTAVTHVSCFGGENGAIDLTVAGANGAVTYSWSNGATTEDISGLMAGTYTVTVTDASNCTATATVTITQPASALTAAASAGSILCNGGTTSVLVVATGGTAPYTGTGTFTRSAGTYSFTVTDANGCTAVATVTITEPAVLVATATAPAIPCNATSTTVTVSATGGTAPYTGTGTFTRTPGTYSFTVTDANGCTAVATITIANAGLTVNAGPDREVCNGSSVTLTANVSGGSTTGPPPATPFSEVSGSTADKRIFSGNIDYVAIGNTFSQHEARVNCNKIVETSATLTIPAGAIVKKAYLYWSGSGSVDNTVKINTPTSGGSWTNVSADGTKTDNISGVGSFFGARKDITSFVTGSGVYRVKDLTWSNSNSYCNWNGAYGAWGMVVVYELSSLPSSRIHVNTENFNMTYGAGTYSTTINNISVPAGCNANAKLTIIGFEGDSYKGERLRIAGVLDADSNNFRGQNGPNFDIITKNAPSITGGTTSLTYSIESYLTGSTYGPAIEAMFDYVKVLKYNNCPTGGCNSYAFQWTKNGATVGTTQSISVSTPGTYVVKATDCAGCIGRDTVVVTACPVVCNISLTTAVTNVSCTGGADGSIDLSVSNATAPITYTWSNGATTQDISGLAAGTYTVTVKDANNCTATRTVTVTAPASVACGPVDPNKCYKLIARHSGKALTIKGSSTSNGADAEQRSYSGSYNQIWKFDQVESGYYRITNLNSGKVLEVDGGSTSNGAQVQQWDWNGGSDQKWSLTKNSSNYFVVKAKHSNKAMSVENSSNSNGADVEQRGTGSNHNEQWTISEVGCPPVEKGPIVRMHLTVTASPNPGNSYFNLTIKSSDVTTVVNVRILDVYGKLVAAYPKVGVNSIMRVEAGNFAAGIYFAEVTQGDERKVLMLVKVN